MTRKIFILVLLVFFLSPFTAASKEYSRDKVLNYNILGLKTGMKASVAHKYLLDKGYVINNGNPPQTCELEFCLGASYSYDKGQNQLTIFTAPSMKDAPVLISRIKYLPYIRLGKYINSNKVKSEGFEWIINDKVAQLKDSIIEKYGTPTIDSTSGEAKYLNSNSIFELYYIDDKIINLLELHNFRVNLYSDLKDAGEGECYVSQLKLKGLQGEYRKTMCKVEMHNNFDKTLTREYNKLLNQPYLTVILFKYANENPLLFELGFNDLTRHSSKKIRKFLDKKEKKRFREELEKAIDFNIDF